MKDKETWQKLYNEALSVLKPRTISGFIEAGGCCGSNINRQGKHL